MLYRTGTVQVWVVQHSNFLYKKGVCCETRLVSHLFFLQHFIAFCFFTYLALQTRLTSRIAKICGGGHIKRPRPARADSSSDKPVKRPRRECLNRVCAAPGMTTSELDAIPVPRRKASDSDEYDEADVNLDQRYTGVENQANKVVATVRPARNVARERPSQVAVIRVTLT